MTEEPEAVEAAPERTFDPSVPLRLTFAMARENGTGRTRLATSDLVEHGMPELQLDDVAGNHCRAGRFLLTVVARSVLKAAEGSADDIETRLLSKELVLTRQDVEPRLFLMFGRLPETTESGPVAVRFKREDAPGPAARLSGTFMSLIPGRRTDKPLHLVPPAKEASNKDQWLRTACRRLGMDAPAPKSFVTFDADMRAATERARQKLPEIRGRFAQGLPDGQQLLVKTGLKAGRGTLEYVWVSAYEWEGGEVTGMLEVEPRESPGFTHRQDMTVAEDDIFDYTIVSKAEGIVVPAVTDIVAQDFGVDLA